VEVLKNIGLTQTGTSMFTGECKNLLIVIIGAKAKEIKWDKCV